MKKIRRIKMNKRISQILGYAVLSIVVVAVILCAVIKLDFKPTMQKLNFGPDQIQIKDSEGTAQGGSIGDKDEYKKFVSKYNDSFKLTVFYSLFSGKLNAKIDKSEQSGLPSFSGYQVTFIYKDSYVLYYEGKQVTTADNSSDKVKYNRITFDVQEDKGLTTTYIYYYNSSNSNSYTRFTTTANFDGLYKYIGELKSITQ